MRKLLLLIVLMLSGTMSGQEIRQIGTNNGLNHPSVYDIAEDPYGIIWLGTRDGLYRYNDGRAKLVPFLSKTDYRRSTNVQALCVSQDSMLWIGIQQGGVMALDLSTHQPLADSEFPQLPTKSSVVGLYEDTFGTLWAGTTGDGIFKLEQESDTWDRISYNTSPENVSFGFDFAQQGDSLWFGTSGDRLIYYDLKTETVRSIGQEDQLNSYRKMVHVQGGITWFAAEEQGVFRYSNGAYERLPDPQAMLDQGIPMNPRDVRSVGKVLWVTTDGYGLWKWEDEEWTEYSKMDPQLGLITDQFYEMEWVNSELWIGTFNGGVTIVPLTSELSVPLRKPDSFIYTSIQSALTLQKVGADIWVGFDGDGLVRYSEDRAGNWQPVEELEAPKVVTSMLEAKDGSVWVGSFREGLRNYSSEGKIQRVFIPYSDQNGGLSNRHIWSLEQGLGDSIWVGTLGGLYLWTGDSMYLPWNDPWEFGRNILDLEQHKSELWVATEYQGIYRLNPDGTHRTIELPFPVLDIHSVDDKVLFGTEGGGLYAWRGESIDTLISDATYSNCYAMAHDDKCLYALTNDGLITFDRQSLEVKSRVNNEEIRAGLFNRKALLSLNNDLLIGASEGVFKFEKMGETASRNSSLAITEVSFDDNSMASQIFYSGADYNLELAVPAGNKSVEFQYEMLGAPSGTPFSVSYKVEGLSNEWTDLGSVNRTFSLGNLDPGTYEVTLRKTDEDGLELGSVVLTLKQEAFVYQTVWFRLIIAALTGLAILGFARIVQERRLRATKLRLLETERELLATRASAMEAKAKEKSDELNFQLLKTSSRVELLKEFKDRLERESVKPNRSDETTSMLKAIIRELNRELQSENYWDHFERNYRDLHDAFSDTLIEQHPKLTKGEVRLSYLIRQKMNNKEIATVLNVSPAAVEKAKYRLKKKIDLGKTDSLDAYIQGL